MRIAVIGATGRTGGAVVLAAADSGHEPVAVVRVAARMSASAVEVRTADALSVPALTAALAGIDAVAWCVGPGRETRSDVMSMSMTATIGAMESAGVRRLVAITASGPFDEGDNPLTRFVAKPILWRVFGDTWRDMRLTERVIRSSAALWTIVRPPQLTDGDPRGYVSNRRSNVRWGFSITRRDLARSMVDSLVDATSIGATISVANRLGRRAGPNTLRRRN